MLQVSLYGVSKAKVKMTNSLERRRALYSRVCTQLGADTSTL